MAKWKLCRQTYGNDVYEFSEGEEVTIGRGAQNTIVLSSLNISRSHCALSVKKDEVTIVDLKSANGIFVGLKKIAPNTPFSLCENDIIGLGWTEGAPLARVNDSEKFVFKLIKVPNVPPSIIDRIQFQNENETNEFLENIEAELAVLDESISNPLQNSFKSSKLSLKRKSHTGTSENHQNIDIANNKNIDDSPIGNSKNVLACDVKRFKSNFEYEDVQDNPGIKIEKQDEAQYEAFNIKQEYPDDDEIQVIDSDSDSEQWYARLSQNSPAKSFSTFNEFRKSGESKQDSSYSQLDDDVIFVDIKKNEESDEELDDLITILPAPVPTSDKVDGTLNEKQNEMKNEISVDRGNEINIIVPDLNEIDKITHGPVLNEYNSKEIDKSNNETHKKVNELLKSVKIVDYIPKPRKKPGYSSKSKTKNYDRKKSKSSSFKIKITNSQKEERKKKLRAIATKDKAEEQMCNTSLSKNEEGINTNSKVNAKVTATNRGAFLIESDLEKCKHPKNNSTHSIALSFEHDNKCKNENYKKSMIKSSVHVESESMNKIVRRNSTLSSPNSEIDVNNKKDRRGSSKLSGEYTSPPPNDTNNESSKINKRQCVGNACTKNFPMEISGGTTFENLSTNQHPVPTETLSKTSTLKENAGNRKKPHENHISSQKTNTDLKSSFKTILKHVNENKPPEKKNIKRVKFSEVQPQIVEFEIEEGNQMRETKSAKTALIATRHNLPLFSLEKIALMKILRWNPQWLEEQKNVSEPPPILGHNNIPMAILHSFSSHTQYVELIGDLLLMEIWECLTQGYIKSLNENYYHQMRIETLPLVSPHRRALDLINISVNVSLPTAQAKFIPREGEIMMIYFGEQFKICRFFFVHHVRCLPSPPNNVNSFYSISLQTSFTEKINVLQRGAVMCGKSLAYINKDLRLFEAMAYLSRSPLINVILNPQPEHFVMEGSNYRCNMESQWIKPLNDSQRKAVMCAITATVEDKPRIQMVQGPPGTGKSRVICAIVMAYFYDAAGKKQKNRGKILICATSNAAVDELVIRLLDIRQSLPHPDRLNMLRVGRVEAMHPRARDISSAKLAQRDVARAQPDLAHASHAPPGLNDEISLLEAKRNMWQSKATDATDDARKAYCQNRVAEITKKIAMFRGGGGGGGGGGAAAPEQLAAAERRLLEGADVVFTTLASAHSYKMRGLARRIALCIVDEAGQAIEPETLVPLTLDVTRLVLVGDPQQLPGFICSQRAKELGLRESLFSRLSSCAEAWGASAAVLLDQQYRMHPHIAHYPNRAFYGGLVRNAALTPAPPLPVAPYFVLGIVSGDKGQDTSGANAMEAWGVARVARALHSAARGASLAVITPYAAQRDLVRRHLRLLQADGGSGGSGAESEGGEEVEVNTVDSFQGQERDVVVVSLARSHGLGFLTDAGRMNVMLTRARHALVLCLNPHALEKNDQWSSLVQDAMRRNVYGTLPYKMCQNPSVQQVSNQEILQYLTSNPPKDTMTNPSHQSKHKAKHDAPRHGHRRGGNHLSRRR